MSLTDHARHEPRGLDRWAPSTPRARPARGRREINWGIWRVPESRARRAPRRRGQGRGRARLRHGVLLGLARAARRAAGRGRHHAGAARDGARDAAASSGSSSRSSRRARRTCRFRTRASTSLVSEYGASIWATRTAGSPRRRGCCGRAASSSSSSTRRSACSARPSRTLPPGGASCCAPYFGMHRFEWPDEDGVEFHLGTASWIRAAARERLRGRGPRSSSRRPRTREPHRYTTLFTPEWAPALARRGDLAGPQVRVSVRAAAPPRVDLAAAAGDPRAAADPVRGRRARVRGGDPPDADLARASTRAGRRARSTARRAARCSASTRGRRSAGASRQARGRGRGRGDARARSAGRTHEVVSGLCLRTAAWEERRQRDDAASRSARSTARDLGALRRSGEWEGRAGGYAIQGLGAASSSGSRATT